MALQGYQAVSFFPQQITDCEYHLAVLDHVFNPNEEDHRDASEWVQDVDSLATYLDNHTDAVSTKFFKSIADESEVKKVKNYFHAVQGSGRDVRSIRTAIGKAKIPLSNDQNSADFTKIKDILVCPPSFLYDSSAAFRAALQVQLADHSWNWVQFMHSYHGELKCSREDAEAFVKANIAMAPADLINLVHHTNCDLSFIVKEASPLELAVLRGDVEEAKQLISVPESLVPKLPETTILDLAVMCGQLEIVKILTPGSFFTLERQKEAARIADRDAHLQILRYFLDIGVEPVISDESEFIGGMKILLNKGASFSPGCLYFHRASNSVTSKRIQRLFNHSISSQVSGEINETLNILFLSHTWQKTGKVDLKRKAETTSVQIDLEGSIAEINCEIMSTTWKEFCLSHPIGVPKDFQDLVGDALRYAAESSHLKAAGYFERYKYDLPVVFPIFIGPLGEYGHYVGCLIRKDYFCIFNGGAGNKGKSIFHGKFQADRMTVDFLKDLMFPRRTIQDYQALVDGLKDRLNFVSHKHDDAFLNDMFDYFSGCQPTGCCSFYNLQKLVPILLACHLHDKIDRNKTPTIIKKEMYAAINTARNISREWELFQQAWLLRNYLYSETRQEYELCHGFVKGILKDSWDLWLDNERSQVTKNILYQCEKRYLDLLSNEDRCNYKADKVAYLTRAWQRHSLYPFRVSAPKDRLR